jgi:FkbM family methyltransferase
MFIETFAHPRDKTWKAVLSEAKTKLPYITNICLDRNVVFQAGGYVGIFPAWLSHHFKTVVTVEPCWTTYKYLCDNLKSYDNINHYNIGISDCKGYGTVKVHNDNCGANELLKDENGTVPIDTIDSIMKDYNDCNLLYLDIEGAEYKALQGARYTIEQYRPIIVLENKGLIPEYKNTGRDGNQEFRDYVCTTFGYQYIKRMMRDDIFMSKG